MTYGFQKLYILFVCLFVCLCRPSLSFRSAKIRCNGVIPHFWELIFVWLFKFLDGKSRKAKYPDNPELGKSFTMRKLKHFYVLTPL